MSEIKHPSLKAELLYLIGRANAPLSCTELYEKCELADEVAQAAKALANLQSDGKIVRVPGEGRARYTLAAGVAAPAPAGKAGRPKAEQADDAAHFAPLTGIRPMPESCESGPPALDIPTLADSGISLQGAAGKTQRAVSEPPELDIPPQGDPRAKGRAEAAHHAAAAERVLGKADKHKASRSDESLADAIIARLKRQLGESMPRINTDLDITTAPTAITINVQRVEINLSLELGK